MVLPRHQPQRIHDVTRRPIEPVEIQPACNPQRVRRNPRPCIGVKTTEARPRQLRVFVVHLTEQTERRLHAGSVTLHKPAVHRDVIGPLCGNHGAVRRVSGGPRQVTLAVNPSVCRGVVLPQPSGVPPLPSPRPVLPRAGWVWGYW
jgi:hypothetical protein